MNWLSDHLQALPLDEAHEGYFLGRGGKETALLSLGVKSWRVLSDPAPDPVFRERYGEHGEKLQGWFLWPLLSPRGKVLGFEGRKYGEKLISRHLLPEAEWQPIWTGLTPETMQRIWAGGDVWVVEGIFDLLPMEWVVPARDVVLGSERARLTDKHIEFLRRFIRGPGQQVWLVYDNDEAGKKGMFGWVDETGKKRWGAKDRLQRVKVPVGVRSYRGKDPGDVWNHGGLAAMQDAFPII